MWCLLRLFFDTRAAIFIPTCSVCPFCLLRGALQNAYFLWYKMSICGSHVAEEHSSAPPLLRRGDAKPYIFTARLARRLCNAPPRRLLARHRSLGAAKLSRMTRKGCICLACVICVCAKSCALFFFICVARRTGVLAQPFQRLAFALHVFA